MSFVLSSCSSCQAFRSCLLRFTAQLSTGKQPLQIFEAVGVVDLEVATPAVDAREAQRDAGFVAFRPGDALEREFEDVNRLHRADRAESFAGMGSNPAVQLVYFSLRSPE